MPFEVAEEMENVVQIKVVGVGGGGGNAVNHMVVSEVQGVEFISLNTDRQALMKSKATVKTVIGEKTCKGGGAGGAGSTDGAGENATYYGSGGGGGGYYVSTSGSVTSSSAGFGYQGVVYVRIPYEQ